MFSIYKVEKEEFYTRNDFKDSELNIKKTKKLSDISKKECIELLQEKGIIGMGGAGFPTYAKYDSKRKINTLIVNAVECEPYITADQILGLNFSDEILEAIDAILEIIEIEEAYIAVKKTNSSLIKIDKAFLIYQNFWR